MGWNATRTLFSSDDPPPVPFEAKFHGETVRVVGYKWQTMDPGDRWDSTMAIERADGTTGKCRLGELSWA